MITPKGFKLLNIDFGFSKFCFQESDIDGFSAFFDKAYKVGNFINKDDYCETLTEVLKNCELNENSKYFTQFVIICYMLPSTASSKNSSRKQKILEAILFRSSGGSCFLCKGE